MRAAGIIRIIVGLVLAVLLTAILVVLLTGNNVFERVGWNGGWINRIVERSVYSSGGVNADTNETVVSESASVPAGTVQQIRIDWVAGSVSVRVGTGSDIVFYETSYRDLTDSQKMRYSVSSGGVLQIRYCDNLDNIFNWFNVDANMPSKELVMEVPESLLGQLTQIEVDSVSAGVDLDGVYGEKTVLSSVSGGIRCANVFCDDLRLSSTSGAITCEACSGDTLTIENVSGGIRGDGIFDKVKVDTVSGSVRLSFASVPSRINVDGVSGGITVVLPKDAQFTAKLDSVSGSISCDFPGTLGNDKIVVGDGSGSYSFNTVSGNLKIEQN